LYLGFGASRYNHEFSALLQNDFQALNRWSCAIHSPTIDSRDKLFQLAARFPASETSY